MKLLHWRASVVVDLMEIESWYPSHVFTRFERALHDAEELVARNPGLGKPVEVEGIDGVRFCVIRNFRYAMYYLDHDDFVEVLAILHHARDTEAALRATEWW